MLCQELAVDAREHLPGLEANEIFTIEQLWVKARHSVRTARAGQRFLYCRMRAVPCQIELLTSHVFMCGGHIEVGGVWD